MSLIVNKPFPIKICFLKNDQKPPEPEPQHQQKISVTFLSSFIQQQKHSLKKSRQSNFMITQEQIDNVQLSENVKPVTAINTTVYEKWRKRKTKSEAEDKRLLTNLLGNDWTNNESNLHHIGPNLIRKNKRTLKDRLDTFQDDQRKKVNNNMMQTHFKTFLSDKKHEPISAEPVISSCFVTKIDQRTYQSLNPTLMNRIKGYNLRGKRSANTNIGFIGSTISETKMRHDIPVIRNNNSFSMGSTLRRNGFKEMANFKWSKLSSSQKFKLNDHS